MFVADVTGFTKLTEHLTTYGPAGLELLVDKLNQLFGIILQNIRKAGGDVMRFAGDAIESESSFMPSVALYATYVETK